MVNIHDLNVDADVLQEHRDTLKVHTLSFKGAVLLDDVQK